MIDSHCHLADEIFAMDLEEVITRTKDGQAKAFLNVCKHRGMTMTDPGRGNCARFSCQYHGWTYANDGRLVGIISHVSELRERVRARLEVTPGARGSHARFVGIPGGSRPAEAGPKES